MRPYQPLPAAGPNRLLMIGCGNMGGAMLARWIAAGTIDPAKVWVVDPGSPQLPEGVRLAAAIADAPAADAVLLAVKPQQLTAARDGGLDRLAPHLLISILAGVDAATLTGVSHAAHVVRAMPNLPVAIGQGVVGLYSATATDAIRATATALMTPLGLAEWIADETLFDAVTALSGSGPGFTYRFIDALAQAGAALGLDADQALRLARATVAGSAALAQASPDTPATLADRVASPGGSTREGLNILDRDDALRRLLVETLAAAERRNAELAAGARA